MTRVVFAVGPDEFEITVEEGLTFAELLSCRINQQPVTFDEWDTQLEEAVHKEEA